MKMSVLSYANILAFTPNSVSKSVPPLGPKPTWQASMLYSDIVPQIYVNETLYGGLPFFKIQVNYFMAQDKPFGAILNYKTFLSFINRLLVTI